MALKNKSSGAYGKESKGLTHVLMCESKDPKLIVSTFGCQNDNVVICCHVSDPFES